MLNIGFSLICSQYTQHDRVVCIQHLQDIYQLLEDKDVLNIDGLM